MQTVHSSQPSLPCPDMKERCEASLSGTRAETDNNIRSCIRDQLSPTLLLHLLPGKKNQRSARAQWSTSYKEEQR